MLIISQNILKMLISINWGKNIKSRYSKITLLHSTEIKYNSLVCLKMTPFYYEQIKPIDTILLE
jgi:hypothetical protein